MCIASTSLYIVFFLFVHLNRFETSVIYNKCSKQTFYIFWKYFAYKSWLFYSWRNEFILLWDRTCYKGYQGNEAAKGKLYRPNFLWSVCNKWKRQKANVTTYGHISQVSAKFQLNRFNSFLSNPKTNRQTATIKFVIIVKLRQYLNS